MTNRTDGLRLEIWACQATAYNCSTVDLATNNIVTFELSMCQCIVVTGRKSSKEPLGEKLMKETGKRLLSLGQLVHDAANHEASKYTAAF